MIWGFVLNGGILTMTWLLANKKRVGFLVGFATDLAWLYWAIAVAGGDVGFATFSVFFSVLHLWSWFKWRKEETHVRA